MKLLYNYRMKSLKLFGFTLIELLIVISIIGLLASVIVSSLVGARNQGIDARVKSEMSSLAKRAAIDESFTFSYDTVCGTNGFSTSSEIVAIVASINTIASSTLSCNGNATAYAASVALGTAHWCVDSTGISKEIPNALTTGQTVCP